MMQTAVEWAREQVENLPTRWESRLYGRWEKTRTSHPGGFIEAIEAERDANIQLRETVEGLKRLQLPLDASNSAICQAAEELASRCMSVCGADIHGAERTKSPTGEWIAGRALPPVPLYATTEEKRAACERIARGQGVEPPTNEPGKKKHVEDGPAIARMSNAQWWRGKLRAVQATIQEGAAIGLGYVNRNADPYVSNESVLRRAQQNERNAAALEATIATNEDGQEYTLAELAATGPANKKIRRAELMTRIAGFERIADDLGHVGLFFTITCPSRMHKWRTARNGHVSENPRYDGTLPKEAQQHLAHVWALIRTALTRRKIGIYGFRIAEPNHDGTPHWHILVFLDPAYRSRKNASAVGRLCAVVRRYALGKGADRTERGAKKHRCDFKPIDKGRGSAAGYIAKYVAKNIDGYRLDKDLIGNDAIETSHRVEAWASTWRIRQFQQIGGAPVGPWRELRRVKEVPPSAPEHLKAAHLAVNKTKAADQLSDSQAQQVKGAQWDKYTAAQGGVFCGRRYAIKVESVRPEGKNRYGEPCAPVPVGVSTVETYTPAHMAHMGGKAERRLIVESARYLWTIAKRAAQAVGRFVAQAAQPLAPWTCVNNCTRQDGNTQQKNDCGRGSHGGQGLEFGPDAYQNDGRGLCPAPC